MRLFFALWPPPAAARALGEWAQEIGHATGGKATAVEKIHLTLAFLGEADPASAIKAGRRVHAKPFDFRLEIARYWPDNHIVWVGPEAMPRELESVVHQLHGALSELGFVLDKRPFAAHLTLLRKSRAPKSIPALPAVRWPVSEFLLVRSALSPKGSAYEPLERFALSA